MKIVYSDFVFAAEDVGLDCDCTIYGIGEETIICNTILHMFEYHAIEPNEITTGMGLKIIENIHVHHHSPPLTSPTSIIVIFDKYYTCQDIAVLNLFPPKMEPKNQDLETVNVLVYRSNKKNRYQCLNLITR